MAQASWQFVMRRPFLQKKSFDGTLETWQEQVWQQPVMTEMEGAREGGPLGRGGLAGLPRGHAKMEAPLQGRPRRPPTCRPWNIGSTRIILGALAPPTASLEHWLHPKPKTCPCACWPTRYDIRRANNIRAQKNDTSAFDTEQGPPPLHRTAQPHLDS